MRPHWGATAAESARQLLGVAGLERGGVRLHFGPIARGRAQLAFVYVSPEHWDQAWDAAHRVVLPARLPVLDGWVAPTVRPFSPPQQTGAGNAEIRSGPTQAPSRPSMDSADRDLPGSAPSASMKDSGSGSQDRLEALEALVRSLIAFQKVPGPGKRGARLDDVPTPRKRRRAAKRRSTSQEQQ